MLIIGADEANEIDLRGRIKKLDFDFLEISLSQIYRVSTDAQIIRQELIQQSHFEQYHVVVVDQSLLAKIVTWNHNEGLQVYTEKILCILFIGNYTRTFNAVAKAMLVGLLPCNEELLIRKLGVEIWGNRSPNQKISGGDTLQRIADKLIITNEKGRVEVSEVRQELEELFQFLFPLAKGLTIEPLDSAAFHESEDTTAAPRFRSAILKVRFPDRLPAIVKIAKKGRISTEEKNYQLHINHQLKGRRYAQIEMHVSLWNIGAIAYSFIGGSTEINYSSLDPNESNDPTYTYTQYFRDKEPEEIENVTLRLFDSWSHYDTTVRTRYDDEPFSLFEQYDLVWQQRFSTRLDNYKNKESTIHISGLGHAFINPIVWVQRNHEEHCPLAVHECVTHGDFHADNIFIDELGHSWFIDFERSGKGPPLQDFVELEVDILTRLMLVDITNTTVLYAVYELIVALCEYPRPRFQYHVDFIPHDSEIEKAIRVTGIIRARAEIKIKFQDSREYLWGLLLNSLFRATYLAENQIHANQLDLCLLLAAILCERLDKWRTQDQPPEPWPPPEWPTVSWVEPDASGRTEQPTQPTFQQILSMLRQISGELQSTRDGVETIQAKFDRAEETLWQPMLSHLDEAGRREIETMTTVIQQELAPIAEIEKLTQSLQAWIAAISRQTDLSQRDSNALLEADRLVNDTMLTPKHRLVATLPIIPFLLAYEGEIEVEAGLNLQSIWNRLMDYMRPSKS